MKNYKSNEIVLALSSKCRFKIRETLDESIGSTIKGRIWESIWFKIDSYIILQVLNVADDNATTFI